MAVVPALPAEQLPKTAQGDLKKEDETRNAEHSEWERPPLVNNVSFDTARDIMGNATGGVQPDSSHEERRRASAQEVFPVNPGSLATAHFGEGFGAAVRAIDKALRPARFTFLCNICYGNCDIREMYCLKGGGGCHHRYCRECMQVT